MVYYEMSNVKLKTGTETTELTIKTTKTEKKTAMGTTERGGKRRMEVVVDLPKLYDCQLTSSCRGL
jgi:hypothetical protein